MAALNMCAFYGRLLLFIWKYCWILFNISYVGSQSVIGKKITEYDFTLMEKLVSSYTFNYNVSTTHPTSNGFKH